MSSLLFEIYISHSAESVKNYCQSHPEHVNQRNFSPSFPDATPLFLAVMQLQDEGELEKKIQVIEALVEEGADCSLKCQKGTVMGKHWGDPPQTPLEYYENMQKCRSQQRKNPHSNEDAKRIRDLLNPQKSAEINPQPDEDAKSQTASRLSFVLFAGGTINLIMGALAVASVIGIGAVLGVILLVLGVVAIEVAAKKVTGLPFFSSPGQSQKLTESSAPDTQPKLDSIPASS